MEASNYLSTQTESITIKECFSARGPTKVPPSAKKSNNTDI